MAGWQSDVATLHVVGFPPNVLDREMENFCRYLPGFVRAKGSVDGMPKVWIRFDSHESASAAIPFIDGEPFDILDPTTTMRASLAKTELNPNAWDLQQPRKDGALCSAGPLSKLIEFATSGGRFGASNGHAIAKPLTGVRPRGHAAPVVVGAPGFARVGAAGAEGRDVRAAPPSWQKGATTGQTIRPPAIGTPASRPQGQPDTLIIMGIGEKGLSQDMLAEFFQQDPSFVALTVASGQGGGHCFIKFQSPGAAQDALQVALGEGLDPQIAKTSLDLSKVDTANTVFGVEVSADESYSPRGHATSWSAKRPRTQEPEAHVEEKDTVVVMGVAGQGMNEESCNVFFQDIEGFVASNFSGAGKGGGNYFVKFASPQLAASALEAAIGAGVDCTFANNSLDPRKLERGLEKMRY